ncbi:MAG: hypothetical protein UT13_C0001G0011 [Candidatus Pacebacteria bacterium GW2011_GWF2_38_9]|nr:MAG: hypothetical protein US01_C0001G0011 [candidate division TM6 bacterium GW2011_GWF2_28_16]KKQ08029.1 MAG: hypothetical protein US20_C0025G0007 [Candidatus Pacebacteria bacterium GW2011_GWF1_36_5]KKQ88365.1 MAG: hypothetical protein UT13_C0001G0011 [Candidatus Pacebacteria bacterium GW2011_GWF2_38_9]HAZ72982.1 hypothetical protein [Candidatus Paceibacterota bacterium]
MLKNHILLEIKTSKDSEETEETAVQLFSTLPKLKNNIFDKLLGKEEALSFEILVREQSIHFLAHIPLRLLEYFKGAIHASYPEAVISELQFDPVDFFFEPDSVTRVASLKLKNSSYLPLKTYQEFKDIDPLSTLMSTLSKNDGKDTILIQMILDNDSEFFPKKGHISAEKLEAHSQKSLIQEKMDKRSLKTAFKIAVTTDDRKKSKLILENIAASYQAITQSDSNSLRLRHRYFFKKSFLKKMAKRSFKASPLLSLSLDETATLFHLPNKKLANIHNISWGKKILGEAPERLPVVDRDTPDEIKNDINVIAETVFKNRSTKYGLLRSDRRRHVYVIGKTGTGKSTLLANMAINDLKHNEGMCVIDPHGDLVETLLDYIPKHRINDVVYFDPSDQDRTVQINLFEGENVVHRELIASGIISVFQKLYSYSWGPRLEYILRNCLLTLLKSKESKLSDVLELLTNKNFRDKIVENLDDPILKSFWVNEYNKMQDRQRQESIASILNKVGQFVSSPIVRNVVNTNQSSFSIEELMAQGKILLVNLSQGRLGEDNATLLGAMMITKIQLAAMARVNVEEKDRRDFYLYVDEFQNFATDAFIKILSEARKYHLNLTLANQYIDQIPEEVRQAIFGNCGNIISFVMGAGDATYFQAEYGGLYTQDDLLNLDKYQIINKISIDNVLSRPFPAYTLNLAKSSNQNREKVIRNSRERYAKKRNL